MRAVITMFTPVSLYQSIADYLKYLPFMNKGNEGFLLVLHILGAVLCLLVCRLIYLVIKTSLNTDVRILPQQPKNKSLSTMIVVGSGGHTTEMLRLVKVMNPTFYSPRLYVMAASDNTSEYKIHETEEFLTSKASKKCQKYSIFKVPRSRSVGQSFITSIFTTTYSILRCVPMILHYRPELVLCNGPGTCIPICFLAFLMRVFFLSNCMIVFIESVCRVTSLSLSGRILYYFADVMLVQWRDLEKKYSRVAYIGRI